MKGAVAVRAKSAIARPLPVLVPLIQQAILAGDRAGNEHYCHAGELLLEAREQVAPFKWGKWLSKNFTWSRMTASRWMKYAERVREDPNLVTSRLHTMTDVVRPYQKAERAHWQSVTAATKQVDVDEFSEARQARADEVQLHRDLALELIDIWRTASPVFASPVLSMTSRRKRLHSLTRHLTRSPSPKTKGARVETAPLTNRRFSNGTSTV